MSLFMYNGYGYASSGIALLLRGKQRSRLMAMAMFGFLSIDQCSIDSYYGCTGIDSSAVSFPLFSVCLLLG